MQTRLLCMVIGIVCLFPLHAQTYFQEDFSTAMGDQAPLGWTQDFGFSSGEELWRFDNTALRVLPAPLEPPYAIFDSHYYNTFSAAPKVSLISPTFSVAGAEKLVLTFDHQYYHGEGSNAVVEVYDGSEWSVVWDAMEQSVGYNSDYPFNILHESHQTVSEYIDITEAIGNVPVAQIRFVYTGAYSFWWAVDNVVVFQPTASDLKMVGLTHPSEWKFFGEQENLAVRIQNTGLQPINFNLQPTTIEVQLNPSNGATAQTFNHTLSSGVLGVGQSKDVLVTSTADFSQATDYEISLTLQSEADENAGNNQKILHRNNQKTTANLPLPTVTFEGFFNQGIHSNLDEISPLWIEAQSIEDNVPMHRYGFSSWWNAAYFAGIPQHVNGEAPFFDFGGNPPFKKEKFWFVGPLIEATEHTEVRFDLAVTAGGIGNTRPFPLDADDEFALAVSTDGGLHYEVVKLYDQNSEISHTGQTEYISLAGYDGQKIKVAFYGMYQVTDEEADDYPLLFLDNIQIYNRVPIDIGILDIGDIRTIGCEGYTDTFPIVFHNFGRETLDFGSRPLSLQISIEGTENHQLTTEWAVGSLSPSETKELAIPVENMPVLPSGNYTIHLTANLAQDGNSFNNSLQFEKTVHAYQDLPLTYIDFTDMKEGHISDITTSYPNWRVSIGDNTPIHDIASWQIGIFGNKNNHPFGEAIFNEFRSTYPSGEWLLSPKFEVTDSASLIYQIALVRDNTIFPDTIPEGSLVQVLISTDCEASFSSLKTYDHTTPISKEGQLENIDLSDYSGQEVVLAFYVWQNLLYSSEAAESSPRLFLDNIFVSDVPLQDLAIIEEIFYYGNDILCTKVPQIVEYKVANYGTSTIENVFLTVDVYRSVGNEYLFTTNGFLSTPISPEEEAIIPIEFNIEENDIYRFIASVDMENDAVPSNDTLFGGALFRRTFLFELPEDTSGCESLVLETGLHPIFPDYFWSIGSTEPQITVNQTGLYWVKVDDDGYCEVRDSTYVTIYNDPPTALFDITDLGDGTFQFINLSTEADGFVWDFGDGTNSNETDAIHTYADNGNYTVVLKAVNPCGETESSWVVTWVGIEEVFGEESETQLQVFPNPSEGLFELKLPQEKIRTLQGDWKIRVRNMQGALVFEKEIRQLTSGKNGFRYLLDLRESVKGVYLVEVWNGEKRWHTKIYKY